VIIPENPKEVNDFTIDVVIRLNRRRLAVQEDGGGTAKWLAIVGCLWQQRQKPVEMTIFPTVPAKRD
jgi:hypothetical protein